MKKVLITGSSGFLGSHLVEFYNKSNFFVVGIDKIPVTDNNEITPDIFIQSDITENALIKLNEKFEIIIHCAGGSSVAKSFENPEQDYKDTIRSLKEVLEYIKNNHSKAGLIYPSSAAVYGLTTNFPIRETEQLNPVSPYGENKKTAEELCFSYHQKYDLNISIIRFFSLYGIGLKKQLLWDACNKFSIDADTVDFFGTGDEVRDWLHIDDAVSLVNQITFSQNIFEIINGGSGVAVKIKEIIDLISNEFNSNKKIIFDHKERTGDPEVYVADITKQLAIPWKPEVSLETGIKNYVSWYKSLKNKNDK